MRGKLEDGQLSNSPLTLKDIDGICEAFATVLNGVFHERIEYPNVKIPEREVKPAQEAPAPAPQEEPKEAVPAPGQEQPKAPAEAAPAEAPVPAETAKKEDEQA